MNMKCKQCQYRSAMASVLNVLLLIFCIRYIIHCYCTMIRELTLNVIIIILLTNQCVIIAKINLYYNNNIIHNIYHFSLSSTILHACIIMMTSTIL